MPNVPLTVNWTRECNISAIFVTIKEIHCCVPLTNTKYHLMHRMEIPFITNYSYQKDAIITWFEVMQQIPAILSSDVNHSYSSLYASLSYAPTLFRIWKPSWNIWGNRQWLTYDGLRYNRPQIGLQWKNLFILPKNWFIVLNTNGNRRGNVDTYMAQPTIRMDFAIQKNMKNWWIKLSALNIFNAKEKGYSRYAKYIHRTMWIIANLPFV